MPTTSPFSDSTTPSDSREIRSQRSPATRERSLPLVPTLMGPIQSWLGDSSFMARALPYLAILIVALEESIERPSIWQLTVTGVLLLIFTVLQATGTRTLRSQFYLPIAAGQALCAIGVVITGATPHFGIILFFVLCMMVVRRLSVYAAIAGAVIGNATLLLAYLVNGVSFLIWFPQILNSMIGFFVFIGFAVMYLRTQQKEAESDELLRELTTAQARTRELAVLQERERIARDMHDAVGHRLTVATVMLEGAERLVKEDSERASRLLRTSQEQVRKGLEELRGAVRALLIQEVNKQPVAQTLEELVEAYGGAAAGDIRFEATSELPEPDNDRKSVIVRTAQEALTNALKHADAREVVLRLDFVAGEYLLTCEDNGRGLIGGKDPMRMAGGFGIESLKVRADAHGGTLELSDSPSGGAVLKLSLPARGGPDG